MKTLLTFLLILFTFNCEASIDDTEKIYPDNYAHVLKAIKNVLSLEFKIETIKQFHQFPNKNAIITATKRMSEFESLVVTIKLRTSKKGTIVQVSFEIKQHLTSITKAMVDSIASEIYRK